MIIRTEILNARSSCIFYRPVHTLILTPDIGDPESKILLTKDQIIKGIAEYETKNWLEEHSRKWVIVKIKYGKIDHITSISRCLLNPVEKS